jgi:hypothetical protein
MYFKRNNGSCVWIKLAQGRVHGEEIIDCVTTGIFWPCEKFPVSEVVGRSPGRDERACASLWS